MIMKTRMKLFTLTIFLAVATFSSAQEKQNDATIEETINWINEYGVKSMVNLNSKFRKPSEFRRSGKESLKYFYLNKSGRFYESVKIKKGKTNSIRIYSSNGVYRVSISPIQVLKTGSGSSSNYWGKGNAVLGMFNFGSNKEYAQKTFKAFEHLFYLLEWKVECVSYLVDKNKF